MQTVAHSSHAHPPPSIQSSAHPPSSSIIYRSSSAATIVLCCVDDREASVFLRFSPQFCKEIESLWGPVLCGISLPFHGYTKQHSRDISPLFHFSSPFLLYFHITGRRLKMGNNKRKTEEMKSNI
ncbi:hypothetical protein SESBI_15927 [Sesbania bispinosa]|nr:hypothetical protein SESBI_15927 [Sesbania bispinosa]